MNYYLDKIKPEDLALCRMQGNLFKYSKSLNYSSDIFIRRFMNSEITKTLDKKHFFHNSLSIEDIFNSIEQQYGKTNRGTKKYSENQLYWMGYLYRYWALTSNKTSKNLYKIINSSKLSKLYAPYHTLSTQQAIERILEQEGINDTKQINEIDILRKIIN